MENKDRSKEIEKLLSQTESTDQPSENGKTKGDSKKKKVSLDLNAVKSSIGRISFANVEDILLSLLKNRKVLAVLGAVVVVLVGYYVYSSFIETPEYKPLPAIHVIPPSAHRNHVGVHLAGRSNHGVTKPAKPTPTTNTNTNTNTNTPKIPVPVLSTVNKKSAESFNQMIKKNTKAIVEATKEQEQKLFDIFKIEPEEEYKIDRLINLAKKQNDFLTIEVSILKKKKQIDELLGQLQEQKARESAMEAKINELMSEVADLRNKVAQSSGQASRKPSKLSPSNPFPLSSTSTSPFTQSASSFAQGSYSDELSNLSVGIIYNYKNKKKIAVVDYNGRIFRVGVGDRVTDHFYVKSIESGGIVVALSPRAKGGVFIPLSFGTGKKIKFGVVNRKTGGSSNEVNYSSAPSSTTVAKPSFNTSSFGGGQ